MVNCNFATLMKIAFKAQKAFYNAPNKCHKDMNIYINKQLMTL